MKKGMMMNLEAGTRKVCGQGRTPILVMGKKGRGRPLDYMDLSVWLERTIRKGKARKGRLSNSCMCPPLKATTVSAWEKTVVTGSTKSQRNIEM